METKNRRTPVKISVSPWKLTLPGKVLAVCLCLLPFLTRQVYRIVPAEIQKAYYLSSNQIADFEQFCREIFLLLIAGAALIWFLYERFTLEPKRETPLTCVGLTFGICIGVYWILGLISAIASPYTGITWLGSYQLYEGYLAVIGYGIVFAAAWYWVDREEVVQFVRRCLMILGIAIGVLALLEHYGICYYNSFLVQALGAMTGVVGKPQAATLTFGNADYLAVFCAMLLPVMIAMIRRTAKTVEMLLQILAAVLTAMTLLMTKVSSAILIGGGVAVVYLVVWVLHADWKRTVRCAACGGMAAAVLAGCFGFLLTRPGDTVGEKLTHTLVGTGQENSFQLLEIAVDGNTVSMKNADTDFSVTTDSSAISPEMLHYYCNGTEVQPTISADGIASFAEPELEHCQIAIKENAIAFELGYLTPVQADYRDGGWKIEGTGGDILDQVPQVSQSQKLQKLYPYLNGRIFVWANTISALSDCWLIGHGSATSILYLNQQNLPALLNIFGRYTLYNKPHNWYLQIAQDTGILSAVIMLIGLVAVMIAGAKGCFGKKVAWDPWKTGLWFAALSYLLLSVFHDSQIYVAPMFWFLLGMGFRAQTAGTAKETKRA